MTASWACNYLQNAAATTYKKFLQFYAKRSCKKHTLIILKSGISPLYFGIYTTYIFLYFSCLLFYPHYLNLKLYYYLLFLYVLAYLVYC